MRLFPIRKDARFTVDQEKGSEIVFIHPGLLESTRLEYAPYLELRLSRTSDLNLRAEMNGRLILGMVSDKPLYLTNKNPTGGLTRERVQPFLVPA